MSFSPGASHKIVALDIKKQTDSERVAFNFRQKKISAYGVEDEILEEIHKFPFPLQRMLVQEASAVMDRLAKGKGAPGLTSLDCHCLFRNRYLLPCKHIFHEHVYGDTKLLTANAWRIFQELFEENGFEVYEGRELVMMDLSEQTEEEKKVENRRLAVNELTERLRNVYFRAEEDGVGQAETFIKKLEASLHPFINDFDAI
jgi:hypothetical protein